MAKKIVEYKPAGDCSNCNASIARAKLMNYELYCMAFNSKIGDLQYEQCQDCKDFLLQEATKVYCNGCKHLDLFNFECMIGEKNENGLWCLNCKSKELK